MFLRGKCEVPYVQLHQPAKEGPKTFGRQTGVSLQTF